MVSGPSRTCDVSCVTSPFRRGGEKVVSNPNEKRQLQSEEVTDDPMSTDEINDVIVREPAKVRLKGREQHSYHTRCDLRWWESRIGWSRLKA